MTCQNWDDSKVILADEALQVVTFGKSLVVARGERPAEYLNIDPTRCRGLEAQCMFYPLGEFRDAMWSGHSPMGCAPRHSLQGD